MVPRMQELLRLIHKRMDELHYTQGDVGKLLGLNQAGVSRRLSGRTRFKMEELEALLPRLGITGWENMGEKTVDFPRLSMHMRRLAPSTYKEMAIALRAFADDLDSAALS